MTSPQIPERDALAAGREGPQVKVTRSCIGCRFEKSEPYAVQGDSGFDVYCTHGVVGKRRVGDSNWTTPDWCPLISAEAAERDRLAFEMAQWECVAKERLITIRKLNARDTWMRRAMKRARQAATRWQECAEEMRWDDAQAFAAGMAAALSSFSRYAEDEDAIETQGEKP